MTDSRDLIQRLIDALKEESDWVNNPKHDELISEALASLNKSNPAMTNYQAKPEALKESWDKVEGAGHTYPSLNPLQDCILELRARVEKLEEAENDRRFRDCMSAINRATPEQIREAAGLSDRSDLVERVGRLISRTVPTDEMFRNEAKAAIREVAVWLEEEFGPQIDWITADLREEAGQ